MDRRIVEICELDDNLSAQSGSLALSTLVLSVSVRIVGKLFDQQSAIYPMQPFIPSRLRAAVLSLFLLGCGSGDAGRYMVTGKVTSQGQPVEQGEITFEDPTKGQVNSSPLGSGGSYSLEVPAGDFKVSVAPPLVETKATADSPPDMVRNPAVKNIPKKYWVQETSGLSAKV